jgi:DNA adenine methylase
MQDKAIVSINDRPEVRACFDRPQVESLDITWQVRGGHRPATRKEPFIFSRDVKTEPARLF